MLELCIFLYHYMVPFQYLVKDETFPGFKLNPLSPSTWSNANFSFQFIVSYVWYIMENLAGDLLLGLKFVKLSILPSLFIHFVEGRLGELRSGYLGLKGLTYLFHCHVSLSKWNFQKHIFSTTTWTLPLKSTHRELSFEWSHLKILDISAGLGVFLV